MNELVFEALKLMVMLAALLVTRYLIPLIRERLGIEKMELVALWSKYAVLKAEQVLTAKDGAERKSYVTNVLKDLLMQKNISLTDEQLDILIESAVRQMKMDEGTHNTDNQ